jgi:hypothetical protein
VIVRANRNDHVAVVTSTGHVAQDFLVAAERCAAHELTEGRDGDFTERVAFVWEYRT